MSYARWTESCDVYCYADVSGGYTTMVSDKGPPWAYNDLDLPSFIARLEALRENGLLVPNELIDGLKEDLATIAKWERRVKPWPDWVLWLMFVLCLVASIGIALFT